MSVREAIAVMMVLRAWAPLARAQANAPLKIEQTIPLPAYRSASIICLWMSLASDCLFRLWATTRPRAAEVLTTLPTLED